MEEKKPHVKTTSNIPRPLNTNKNAKTGSFSGELVSVEADRLKEQVKSIYIYIECISIHSTFVARLACLMETGKHQQ